MFKELLDKIFENIHELGHPGTEVDDMMDAVVGMGHRIKWGHDLQGMINAFDIHGVSGLAEWFHHMALDFTSADGLPLPFAEAIVAATGMDMDDAIDWLCINLSDVVEAGGEIALLKYFKERPKLYNMALAIGAAIGIIDHNPVMLAVTTLHAARVLREKGVKLPYWDNMAVSLKRGWVYFKKAAMSVAAVDCALGLMQVDLVGLIEHETYEDILIGADITNGMHGFSTVLADAIDGLASMGIVFGISEVINYLLKPLHKKTAECEMYRTIVRSLQAHLRAGTSPKIYGGLLALLEETPYYPH